MVIAQRRACVWSCGLEVGGIVVGRPRLLAKSYGLSSLV